jgi:cyclopropane-fatty-acyl-phospholipid synthase
MLTAEWSIQPTWMMPRLQMSIGANLFKKYLSQCPDHALRVTFPNGEVLNYGDGQDTPAEMIISDDQLFIALLWSGDIGLGEAFVEGYWDSPNPTAVMEFLPSTKSTMMIKAGVYLG